MRRELYLSSSLMYSGMNSEGNFGSFSRWRMFFTFSSCNYKRKKAAVCTSKQANLHTHHTPSPPSLIYTPSFLSLTTLPLSLTPTSTHPMAPTDLPLIPKLPPPTLPTTLHPPLTPSGLINEFISGTVMMWAMSVHSHSGSRKYSSLNLLCKSS